MNQQVINNVTNDVLSYETNEVKTLLSRKKKYEQYKIGLNVLSHVVTSVVTILSFLSTKWQSLAYASACVSLLINICIVNINTIHESQISNDTQLQEFLKNMNVNIIIPNDDQTPTPINTPI